MERDRFRDFMSKKEKPLSRRVKRGIAAIFSSCLLFLPRDIRLCTPQVPSKNPNFH